MNRCTSSIVSFTLSVLAYGCLSAETQRAGAQGDSAAPASTPAAAPAVPLPADRPTIADPTTGRDLRSWPPDRYVDFTHMRLDVDVADLNAAAFRVAQRLSFRALGNPVESLTLDAVKLRDLRVTTEGGTPLPMDYDGSRLTIRFPAPIAPGQEMTIVSTYGVDHPEDGVIFAASGDGAAAQFHTQGQAESNRFWFPCHDSPNERLSTELVVTVPEGVVVSGNGRLASHTTESGRETWHWVQSKPHVAYLVSLVAGDFERTPLPPGPGGVPMTVWARPGQADDVRETFARTGQMMAVFERAFGVPYPWDRYDQLCARGFQSGGMENTSATTLMEDAVLDARSRAERDMDGLIAHELCHQWTGDYITCHDWRDIWLNEGWATYGEALWFEARDGADGYFDEIDDNARVAHRDRVARNPESMCWNVGGPASFGRAANPYPKGASILHMVREMLGDEVFFEGVHLYMKRHGLATTETSDFRRALEDVSGRELAWFFDQWCQRPGCPEITVKGSWANGDLATLHLDITQTQPIDGYTPAFRLTLPIRITTASGEVVERLVEMRERSASLAVPLGAEPVMVEVDPRATVLKLLTLDVPQSWLAEQVRRGSTLSARRVAARALPSELSDDSVAALVDVARNPAARESLRVDAIEVLGRSSAPAALAAIDGLFAASLDRGRVRAAVVEAYAADRGVDALPAMVSVLRQDAGIAPRVAACEAVSRWKPIIADHPEVRAVLVALCDERTSGGRLEGAAMDACAELGIVEALPAVERLSVRGQPDRERSRALRLMAGLAPKEGADRDRVVGTLVACLDDPEDRCFRAAGESLRQMKAEEALPALEAVATTSPREDRRSQARRWADAIAQ